VIERRADRSTRGSQSLQGPGPAGAKGAGAAQADEAARYEPLSRGWLRRRVDQELGDELAADPAESARLDDILADLDRDVEGLRDAVSTRLMEIFRFRQSRTAFGLLFELNRAPILAQVTARLRRYASKSDPHDVLQEVFVNIYRYPHRFDATRDDAFRVWTATIVRNTVLKHLRSLSRSGRAEIAFEDLPEPPEPGEVGEPLRGVIESESQRECRAVFVTYLHLYLRFYSMLSEREQRAIHLVEVDGSSYRQAAAELGIRLENLKMVIFRARRKIHRSMRRVFEGLPPDVKPARDPRPVRPAGPGLESGDGTAGPGNEDDAGSEDDAMNADAMNTREDR